MLPSALLPDVNHENIHHVVRIRIRIYFRQVKVYKRANNRVNNRVSAGVHFFFLSPHVSRALCQKLL